MTVLSFVDIQLKTGLVCTPILKSCAILVPAKAKTKKGSNTSVVLSSSYLWHKPTVNKSKNASCVAWASEMMSSVVLETFGYALPVKHSRASGTSCGVRIQNEVVRGVERQKAGLHLMFIPVKLLERRDVSTAHVREDKL